MKRKFPLIILLIIFCLTSGCGFSPFSRDKRPEDFGPAEAGAIKPQLPVEPGAPEKPPETDEEPSPPKEPPPRAGEAEEHTRKGLELMENKEYEKAIAEFMLALAKDKYNRQYQFNLEAAIRAKLWDQGGQKTPPPGRPEPEAPPSRPPDDELWAGLSSDQPPPPENEAGPSWPEPDFSEEYPKDLVAQAQAALEEGEDNPENRLQAAQKYVKQFFMIEFAGKIVVAAAQKLPEAKRPGFIEKAASHDWSELSGAVVEAMAELFSVQEVEALSAFNSSEAGMSILKKQASGRGGLTDAEKEALVKFYETPEGSAIKRKKARLSVQVTPLMDKEIMKLLENFSS